MQAGLTKKLLHPHCYNALSVLRPCSYSVSFEGSGRPPAHPISPVKRFPVHNRHRTDRKPFTIFRNQLFILYFLRRSGQPRTLPELICILYSINKTHTRLDLGAIKKKIRPKKYKTAIAEKFSQNAPMDF